MFSEDELKMFYSEASEEYWKNMNPKKFRNEMRKYTINTEEET